MKIVVSFIWKKKRIMRKNRSCENRLFPRKDQFPMEQLRENRPYGGKSLFHSRAATHLTAPGRR